MNPNPPETKRADEVAVFLLALPYLALKCAGRMIMKAAGPKSSTTPESSSEVIQDKLPAITPKPLYNVANRVHSTIIYGKKFCFYQYFDAEIVRVTSRGTGVLREEFFTPAIAVENSLLFSIDGAIEWVRGAQPTRFGQVDRKPKRTEKDSVKVETAVLAKATTAPAAAPNDSTIVPPPANKAKPFTGHILFCGEVERTGLQDKKPYITYSVRLRAESGLYEKEFIGEHLAELVSTHSLKIGMLVRLQLLGKHHFTVVVDGKTERRSRNEFALTVVKN